MKNLDDLPERGMRQSTSKKNDKAILRIFAKNPECSLRKAKLLLSKKSIEVSLNIIRRRLRDATCMWRYTKFERKTCMSVKNVYFGHNVIVALRYWIGLFNRLTLILSK